MTRTFVILNPAAGSVKDVDALVEGIRHLPDVEVCITAKAGAAMTSTRRALRKGCEMVVAAGGDGTLNEVVNGPREDASAVAVGLIPLGTGNDFARTLGLPADVDDVVIANGLYVGGGTLIAPEASIDDGLLDIILIQERSTAELALLAAQVALGDHLSKRCDCFPPRGKSNREFATGDVVQCGRRTGWERAGCV